jgi:hypothetical protein
MGLWFKASKPAVVELYPPLHALIQAQVKNALVKSFNAPNGVALHEKAIEMNLNDGNDKEIEEYVIFAYPEETLKRDGLRFPAGCLLHGEGIHDRVIHPFYRLGDDGRVKGPDPGMMAKVTLPITIRPSRTK